MTQHGMCLKIKMAQLWHGMKQMLMVLIKYILEVMKQYMQIQIQAICLAM